MTHPANKFSEFEASIRADVGQAVRTVIQAAINHALTSQQISELGEAFKEAYPAAFNEGGRAVADPQYGANFSLQDEVNSQIRLVRAMRDRVLAENGGIKDGVSLREAKEVIGSSNTMLQALMKSHEKILNMERTRAMESAIIEAISTLPEEAQSTFFGVLETALAKQD